MKNLRIPLILITIFFLLCVKETLCQSKGFELPSKYVKVLLVSDTTCPIQLIGPTKVIGYDDGTILRGYKMQNTSKLTIKEFKVEELSWFGNVGYSGNFKNENFLPSMIYSSLTKSEESNLTEFNEHRATNLKLSEHLRDVWIVMIKKATFADGTVYDATSKFNKIEKFIDSLTLTSKMSKAEINAQQEIFHSYIESLKLIVKE